MLLFKCPVCNQPLEKKERVLCCKNNHSYDIAKKGYINLLLANQGNHFLEEGDKKDAVVARTAFLNTGVYDYLRQEIIKTMKSYFGDEPFNFCDLACGEGYYTTEIHQNFPEIQTYGVDISKAAITALCTRKNMLGLQNFQMAIGNLDYLPFVDESEEEAVKEAVKLNALVLLNEMYDITEKDFLRAEIEFVPATKAMDVGLDRSMIGAYGQDDKVCAYTALTAEIDTKNPYYCSIDGVLYLKGLGKLVKFPEARTGDFFVPLETTTIAEGAFCGTNLNCIRIGESIKVIERQAFVNGKIKELHIQNKRPKSIELDKDAFASLESCILYVPIGTGYRYRHDERFNVFKEVKIEKQETN